MSHHTLLYHILYYSIIQQFIRHLLLETIYILEIVPLLLSSLASTTLNDEHCRYIVLIFIIKQD